MTPEAKLRTLAAQSATLSIFFGTDPLRWFDTQLPPGQISSGCCAVIRRISTVRTYEQRGIQNLSQPRFQIDVLAPNTVNKQADPETGRAAAEAVIAFLSSINLATEDQFASPPITPPNYPNFVLNQRDGLYFELQPPCFVQSIDVRVYNLEPELE